MNLRPLRRMWSTRRRAAGALIYWTGLGRAFEAAARPAGAIILMYHSVADGESAAFVDPPNRVAPALFEQQMAFLQAHRRVTSLSHLIEDVAAGRVPPPGTVCLTFDDGYLDNLTVAAPILERYRLPATLFLATGYVERAEPQWADVLHWQLTRRTSQRLALPGIVEEDLRCSAGLARARRALHRLLLEATHAERAELLAEAGRQLAPQGRMPRLTLRWDEVRELRRRHPGFEIGGHTRDHLDLRSHRGEVARAQIEGCAADVRRELGESPGHFSFPYARWCPETRALVEAAGWASAVGAGERLRIDPGSDRFALPRVEAPGSMTALRFETSGANPGALAVLGIV